MKPLKAFLLGLALMLGAGPLAAALAILPKVSIAADGRSFVTADGRPFVPFGVTYFRPNTGWAPQVWKRWDPAATRRDFARMKALGVNTVRVFLSFGSFLSEPGKVDAAGLAKFREFLSLAEEAGLYVHPTGPDHWEGLPEWAREDRIADEVVLASLELFWKQFATEFKGRPSLFAYDLLNEPEVRWDTVPMRAKWARWLEREFTSPVAAAAALQLKLVPKAWTETAVPDGKVNRRNEPALLAYQRFREEVADEWTRRQVAAIKAADPQALVTAGLIQWSVPASLAGPFHYAAFRPARQAALLDFMEVHFYPLDHGAYDYRDDESERRNLAYLEAVVGEVARSGKPVVVAEFGWYGGGKPRFDGGRHPFATEEQQARWCRRLVESTRGLAQGWLNWGVFDQPEATDPSEFSGLLTADGKEKAWGREFRRLAGELQAGVKPVTVPRDRPPLDWDAAITDTAAGNEFRARYYDAWRRDH